MGLNLIKIAAHVAPLAIDMGDGQMLQVEYDPSKITSELQLGILAIANVSEDAPNEVKAAAVSKALNSPIDLLAYALVSWSATMDAEDGSGEVPMPLDRDHLLLLPTGQVNTIASALMTDAAAATSGKSSAPTAKN